MFVNIMQNAEIYFAEANHYSSCEALILANYLLCKTKFKELDENISIMNAAEKVGYEAKCVQRLVEAIKQPEVFSELKYQKGSTWKYVAVG